MKILFQHKKQLLVLALAALVGFGGYSYYQGSKQTDLVLYGNVDIRQVSLAFNASERIDKLFVKEGQRVEQGQLLAALATENLTYLFEKSKAQLAQQEAVVRRLHNGSRPEELEQAAARVRQADADALNALQYKERLDALYAQHAISMQQRDDASARYKAAAAALDEAQEAQRLAQLGPREEDIAEAEAALKTLQAEVKLRRYNLEQAQLKAPQKGIIRSRLQEPGDMASPQKPVFLLTTDEKKWVRAYIPETALGKVQPGQQAKIYIDSQPDKPLDGTVGYISHIAEFTPKSVQTEELRTALLYEVRINAEDPDDILRMGMPATVRFD